MTGNIKETLERIAGLADNINDWAVYGEETRSLEDLVVRLYEQGESAKAEDLKLEIEARNQIANSAVQAWVCQRS